METREFAIGELEEVTGVPRRTIYFYVQQGILPPPSGAGLAARYHQSHLLRLQAIPRLREIGWRLDRIREFFQSATDAEIQVIVEGAKPVEEEPVAFARSAPSPIPPAPSAARPTLFARYSLAPGVDLFVQRDLPPSLATAMERLLSAAAMIFGQDGVDARDSADSSERQTSRSDSISSTNSID